MRPSGRSSRAGWRKCRTYLKCCSGRLWSSVVTGVAAASWPCMGVPPIACRGMGGTPIHLRPCRGPENRPVLGGQTRNQPGTAARDRIAHDHGHFSLADSGGRRNALQVVGEELSERFARGVVAEPLAGPVVELAGDGVDLGGGVLAEVGALGEVLAEQAVD